MMPGLDGFGLVDRAAARVAFRPQSASLREAARDEFFLVDPVVAIVVLDESTGRPEDGIAPGTAWADVPMNWTCPECGARKEDFEMMAI